MRVSWVLDPDWPLAGVGAGAVASDRGGSGVVAEGLRLKLLLLLLAPAVGERLLGALGVDLLLREVVGTTAGYEFSGQWRDRN